MMLNYLELSNILLSVVRVAAYIEGYECRWLLDRKTKLKVDVKFWGPIIRPTSGAVETENSLVNNELRSFRQ